MTHSCHFYLDTFILPYGGDDGASQWFFIEDLSTLLSSCTDGKHRKSFFEIDKEFESMTVVVKSNFVTVDSFLLSMCASLRQVLII